MTKAYYPISEIGAKKPGFSKTRSIIETAFYGNNPSGSNKWAFTINSGSSPTYTSAWYIFLGTIVTDMPVYRGEEFGLEKDAKVLLFNDGSITGRYAAARRIAGEPNVNCDELDKMVMDAVYDIRWKKMYHANNCSWRILCQFICLF